MGNQHQRKEVGELISWFAQSEELILSVYSKYALRHSLRTVIDEHMRWRPVCFLFVLAYFCWFSSLNQRKTLATLVLGETRRQISELESWRRSLCYVGLVFSVRLGISLVCHLWPLTFIPSSVWDWSCCCYLLSVRELLWLSDGFTAFQMFLQFEKKDEKPKEEFYQHAQINWAQIKVDS